MGLLLILRVDTTSYFSLTNTHKFYGVTFGTALDISTVQRSDKFPCVRTFKMLRDVIPMTRCM